MTDILSLIPKKLPYDIIREISTYGRSVYWCNRANKFVSRVSEDLIRDMSTKIPVIRLEFSYNYTFHGRYLPNYEVVVQKNDEHQNVRISILKAIFPTGCEWKLVTVVRTPLYDEKGRNNRKCEKRTREDVLKTPPPPPPPPTAYRDWETDRKSVG